MTDEFSPPISIPIETALSEREQEILDTALLESDQLLVRSLHHDEQTTCRVLLAVRLRLLTPMCGSSQTDRIDCAILGRLLRPADRF